MANKDNRGRNAEYIYIAIFLEKEEVLAAAEQLGGKRLANIVEMPHVTLAFRPEEVDSVLFGAPADVIVTGYGNDGRNEGLKVQVRTANARLQEMADRIPVAHVTVSLAEDARAQDTAKIEFRGTGKTILLHGVYGAFSHEGKVVFR